MELGVAIVGLGIGEQHARAYVNSGRCRIRWLYDIDAPKAQQLASQLPVDGVATSFEQVLDDRTVQVISIASYDDAHASQVIAALEAGKHVFVEKPLCLSATDLSAIQHAWSNHSGAHLLSNLVLRASPAYVWLKNAIAAGDLGTIYSLDGDYLYGRIEKITTGWRKNVHRYSPMLGGGVHMADLLLWLTAEKPTSVSCVGNRICTKQDGLGFNDYQAAVFSFASGLVGRITANCGCVHAHQHVLRVFGTAGTFLNDDRGPRLHVTRDPHVRAADVQLPTLPGSKGDLIGPFIESILRGCDSRAAALREFDLMSVCLAAELAGATGQTVAIEYL